MSKAPPRPSMSKARRLRIFARDGGRCEICGKKVQTGEDYDIDHRLAWALTFDDGDDNLRTVHKSCHRDAGAKTADDVKRIAKAKRQSGIEGGQAARRAKRGHGLIQSRTDWPKGRKLESRPFSKPRREK